jgi:hypothetical protein
MVVAVIFVTWSHIRLFRGVRPVCCVDAAVHSHNDQYETLCRPSVDRVPWRAVRVHDTHGRTEVTRFMNQGPY